PHAVAAAGAGDRAEARRTRPDGAARGDVAAPGHLLQEGDQHDRGHFSKKEINTIDDMKGLKWRAYNVGTARIGELVGAQAVTIQAAELPQALATGVVNSFMSSGATGYDSKVWESLTHFYDTKAWIPKNVTIVNKAAFDALDKPAQEAVMKAVAAAEARGWKLWENKTEWYHQEIAKKGMKVLAPSAELQAGFRK